MESLTYLALLMTSSLCVSQGFDITCSDSKFGNGLDSCIIDRTSDAHVNIGERIQLNCTFIPSKEFGTNCIWKRNGTVVRLGGRYKSSGTNFGRHAQCSIEISDAKVTDSGNWTCGVTSDTSTVNSPNITVTVREKGTGNKPNLFYILIGVAATLILILSSAIIFMSCTKREANEGKASEMPNPAFEQIDANNHRLSKNVPLDPGSLNQRSCIIHFEAGSKERNPQIREITDEAGYQVPFNSDGTFVVNTNSGTNIKLVAIPQLQSQRNVLKFGNEFELSNIVSHNPETDCYTSDETIKTHSELKNQFSSEIPFHSYDNMDTVKKTVQY